MRKFDLDVGLLAFYLDFILFFVITNVVVILEEEEESVAC